MTSAPHSACASRFLFPQSSCGWDGACVLSPTGLAKGLARGGNETATGEPEDWWCACAGSTWRNFGDASFTPGGVCVVHNPSVRGLWGASVALVLVLLGYTLWVFRVRTREKWPTKRELRRKWKVWAVAVGSLAYCVVVLALAIGKLASEDGTWDIGKDVAPSILCSLALLVSLATLLSGAVATLEFTSAQADFQDADAARDVKRNLHLVKQLMVALVILGVPASFGTVIMLADPPNLAHPLMAWETITFGVLLFVCGAVIVPSFLTVLIRQLERTKAAVEGLRTPDENSKDIVARFLVKLRRARVGAVVTCTFQAALAIIFGAVPVCLTLFAYLFPLILGTNMFLFMLELHVTTNERNAPSRSPSRVSFGARKSSRRPGGEATTLVPVPSTGGGGASVSPRAPAAAPAAAADTVTSTA